jgi:hypothetical protein
VESHGRSSILVRATFQFFVDCDGKQLLLAKGEPTSDVVVISNPYLR